MKEQIRQLVLSLGADLCGFANIDRFGGAPSGFSPADILPECRSVISFAMVLPRGLLAVNPRIIYGYYNDLVCPEVDKIAFKTAKALEENYSCLALPLPCDVPYEYWDEGKLEGRGLMSMKHAAAQAGLGAIGKNTLLLNKKYGNLLTLGAVLTSLDLPSDPLYGEVCIPGCSKCAKACPVGAIKEGGVTQKLCRNHTYGKTMRGFSTVDCNACRAVCPMNGANDGA